MKQEPTFPCTRPIAAYRSGVPSLQAALANKKYALNRTRVLSFSLLLCICSVLPVFAGDTSDEGAKNKTDKIKPAAAVNSHNGSVFKVGQYGVIFKYYDITRDNLYEGSSSTDFVRPAKGKKVSEQSIHRTELILRTGIYDNFDIRVIVPYLDKELDRQSLTADFSDDNSGLGDIKLLSRYQVFSQKTGPFNMAIGLGVQIPTGSTDETDDSGNTLPAFLQTGSGSWNPILELGVHKIIGRHWVSSYFAYLFTTEGEFGDMDFERPDMFKYNVAYSYALSRLFDVGIEFNGEYNNKAILVGSKLDNTGGHRIFISPEVHWKFAKGMHLDICVPIAVYQDLNGLQTTEDYRIVAKLAMTF